MFRFGENWQDYSKLITKETLEIAKSSILSLLDSQKQFMEGRSFLDIGCGSGLFSIAAYELGASRILGVDVDALCVETSRRVAGKFQSSDRISFLQKSILDDVWVKEAGFFDFVYAWGSLHHTGKMWKAIENACRLTRANGIFILAIYNRHWTSRYWRWIKKIYNWLPAYLKPLMTACYVLIFMLLRLPSFLKSMRGDSRGMTLLTDARDWLGGWPYEYADVRGITQFMESRGFRKKKIIPCKGYTGCNQFVFEKIS